MTVIQVATTDSRKMLSRLLFCGWVFGPNCRATCPYPNYGHWCTERCECPKDQCDVSEGCKLISLQPNTASPITDKPLDFYFVDGTCKPCEPGFFGPNCRASCPYPNYGHRCTERCECPKDQCDVSEGCKQYSLQLNTATNSTPDPNPNKQVTHTGKYNVNTGQTANEDDLSDNSGADSQTSDKPLGKSLFYHQHRLRSFL
uniref:Uncharacterized protein n=1 Tax=Magallana gigas TaxID=29159 RepID=A0A8W8L7E1_MAGGI